MIKNGNDREAACTYFVDIITCIRLRVTRHLYSIADWVYWHKSTQKSN